MTNKNELLQKNGYLYDETTKTYYMQHEDKLIPMISNINGGNLEPVKNNIWMFSGQYYVYDNGNIIPVINPISKNSMIPTDNPKIFRDNKEQHNFIYDSSRKSFIPNYLPDENLNYEPAHIEDNFLVGNNTGLKFKIDDDGTILTPKNEKIRNEVNNYRPQNGIWQGHKFMYDDKNNKLFVIVNTPNGIEYKEGFFDNHNITVFESNEIITLDKYDMALITSMYEIITKRKAERLKQKYNQAISATKQQGIQEAQEIKEDGFRQGWQIERDIQKIDNPTDISEYFKQTIKNSKSDAHYFIYEFIMEDKKCYYSATTKDKNGKAAINQATVFNVDDVFKKEFFEPFIIYQIENDKTNSILFNDKQEQQDSDIVYISNLKNNHVIIKGMDKEYINLLIKKIEAYREKDEVTSHYNQK